MSESESEFNYKKWEQGRTQDDWLRLFLDFYSKNRKYPSSHYKNSFEERSLAAWLHRLKVKFLAGKIDSNNHVVSKLVDIGVDFEIATRGEKIERAKKDFLDRYNEFIKKYRGSQPKRRGIRPGENKLGEQIRYLRKLYWEGLLTEDEIRDYKEAGVVFDPIKERKKKAIKDANEIISFIQANRKQPSRFSDDPKEKYLAQRLYQFKQGYKDEYLRKMNRKKKCKKKKKVLRRLDGEVMRILILGGAFEDKYNLLY